MTSQPHHAKIQRRLGWLILAAGLALSAINLIYVINSDEAINLETARVFNALWLTVFALVLFLLSRIDRPVMRFLQVLFFGLIGLFAMYVNERIDMTGMIFVTYAIFLAIQYSFLDKHFVRKLVAIIAITIVLNALFMFLHGEVILEQVAASAAFIVLFLLMLWIAFAETLKTYIDRTRELELERRKESVFVRFGKNTAGLVHNLRNMLSVAYGFNDIIRNETDSDHLKSLIARERAAYDRMSSTIERTLAIVKAKQETSTKEVDLNELIVGLVDFLKTDLELKHNVQTNLDLCSRKLIVSVQPLELCEVIENLIRNSWEAMRDTADGRQKLISIRTFDDPNPGLSIRDNGPGVDDFTSCSNDECRLYFAIGKTTKDDGTGLGVPIILEAAKSNGWEVSITNIPEGGLETTIVFREQQSEINGLPGVDTSTSDIASKQAT